MEEEFNNSNENNVSEYNSGIAILYRIDNLWQSFHHDMIETNFVKANFILDRVWQELSSDASVEELELFRLIDKKIKEFYSNNVTKRLIYDILLVKERYIRTIQNKQGKGVRYKESADDYFDD